ncbi:hypothetical protein EQZ23_18005 [Sphingomonas sp. UV9]|uniref:hypothetical protein n=1 Tax=Sphingomonas sp. UV9 TaxID=1851410 RepID=UPI000FFC37B1|nr:hypothetical protein [Sphingomonas sp. UV9]RXD02515.1 hypothetical protein EQZ23_18005 [Sphingomonas sp. UV9]
MKMIGAFLLACVLLSVLQAALSILIVAGLIVGIFVRPAATFGLLVFGLFARLLQSDPVGAIWLATGVLIVVLVCRAGHSVNVRPPSPPSSTGPAQAARKRGFRLDPPERVRGRLN